MAVVAVGVAATSVAVMGVVPAVVLGVGWLGGFTTAKEHLFPVKIMARTAERH